MPTEFEIRPMFAKYSAISMDRLRVWQSFGEDEFECYEHSQTPPGRAVGGRRSLGSLATAMRSVIATLVAFLLAGCAAPTHSSRPEAGKLVAQERKEADAILNGRHERVCAAIEKYMAAKKVTGAPPVTFSPTPRASAITSRMNRRTTRALPRLWTA
jgi:hypothetical protein